MMRRMLDKVIHEGLARYRRKRYNWIKGHIGFPLDRLGNSYLDRPLFSPDGREGYYCGIYNEEDNPRWYEDVLGCKLELLRGGRRDAGRRQIFPGLENCVLPYRLLKRRLTDSPAGRSVSLRLDGRSWDLKGQWAERFYYLRVNGRQDVELESDTDWVAAAPIPLRQASRRRRRLVLMLFVDGWSWEVFSRASMQDTIPNLLRFFSKGMMFDNCHVTSDWSLPGLASIHSGLRVRRHGMFHPSREVVLGDYPVLGEFFQRDGYLTFQACGNWRKTPSYGYARGFDRTVYKRQMQLKDVQYAFLDQLRAFPERDQFAWLSYFDLHHLLARVPDVGAQAAYPPGAHDYSESGEKSVLQVRTNEGKAARYVEELRKVDFHLGQLFRFIESRYAEDELLVALVSDHGTGYLTPGERILSRERTHVPFMVRGGGVPQGRSREWMQNVDVLPLMLRLAGIEHDPSAFDGRVPARFGGPAPRSHAVCESFYPGSPYRATIKDDEFDFYYETRGGVDGEGRFDPSSYTAELCEAGRDGPASLKGHPAAGRYEALMLDFLRTRTPMEGPRRVHASPAE